MSRQQTIVWDGLSNQTAVTQGHLIGYKRLMAWSEPCHANRAKQLTWRARASTAAAAAGPLPPSALCQRAKSYHTCAGARHCGRC